MQAHILKGTGEQFGYARLLQQGSLVFKPNFNAHDVVRLIDDDLVLLWCQKSPCALSFSLGYRPIGFMFALYQTHQSAIRLDAPRPDVRASSIAVNLERRLYSVRSSATRAFQSSPLPSRTITGRILSSALQMVW